MEFGITEYTTHLSTDEFVEWLMKKRIGQGEAEKFQASLNQQPHVAYSWTDGIYSIYSVFQRIDENVVQEISIATRGIIN